jgi:hypothetical protein
MFFLFVEKILLLDINQIFEFDNKSIFKFKSSNFQIQIIPLHLRF